MEKFLEDEKLSRDEWIKRDVRPAAEKRVRNSLVLAQLSKNWQISASEDEVKQMQDKILAQYTEPQLKANFETDEAKQQIAQQIIADKTLKKLVEASHKNK